MVTKSWVRDGRVFLKVPYGVFNKKLFPRTTRTFDPTTKAWVVDLNLHGKTSEEKQRVYKAAAILRDYYMQFLSPEVKGLLYSVLSAERKDRGYSFFLQGGKFYLDVVWGTPLWTAAKRWLEPQGNGFYADIRSDRFSYFLASIAPEVKQEIAREVKRSFFEGQNEELARIEAEIFHLYPYLFDFQVKGAAFLAVKRWAILADPMGLGKTLQGLCSGDYLLRKGVAKRVVVICEAKRKNGWYEHLTAKKFLAKSPSEVALIKGPRKKRLPLYRKRDAKFFILNYELVLRDFEEISKIAKGAFIVIDEASKLKNRRAKTHKKIKALVPLSAGTVALTGTPMENGAEDFFALAQLLNLNVRTKKWKDFLDRYCITRNFRVTSKSGRSFEIKLISGYKNLDSLRREFAPYFLRRSTAEVEALLPKIRVENLEIPLDPIQKSIESVLFSHIRASFEEELKRLGKRIAEKNILVRLTLAKVIEASPVLLGESSSPLAKVLWAMFGQKINSKYKSPKEAAILSALFQIDTPVVVFTQFKRMAKRLYKLIGSVSVNKKIFIVTGETTGDTKTKTVAAFKKSRAGVLITTDVLSYGENLENAGAVINFDLPWNPQKLEQRQRRIVRISSKHESVLAVNFISEGIEHLVAETLKFKLDVFSELVEGHQAGKRETSELRKALKRFIMSHGIRKIDFINPPSLQKKGVI